MNYAHLDDKGQFLKEDSYDPPLGPKEITFWDNGNPKIAPLIIAGRNPGVGEKAYGFDYNFDGIQVVKSPKIVAMTPAEIKAEKNAAIKDKRISNLPTYDDVVELLCRVLIGVVEKQAMTETPGDPRSKNLVTKADLNQLKALLTICEQNVLEP